MNAPFLEQSIVAECKELGITIATFWYSNTYEAVVQFESSEDMQLFILLSNIIKNNKHHLVHVSQPTIRILVTL